MPAQPPLKAALASILAFLVLSLTAGTPARAELGFLVSGIHHVSDTSWAAMSDASKIAFLEQRADLAVALGADAVRVGDVAPHVWSAAGLGADTSVGRWTWADKVVAIFAQRELTLVIVVPDIIGSGLTAYRTYIEALAERYDGDTDFGVPMVDNNRDFPDVDDTGAITSADWGAPAAQQQAWAEAHVVDVIEVGNRPYDAEQAGTVSAGDYGTQLKTAAAAIRDSGSNIKVMLGGTVIDQQNASTFSERLGAVDAGLFDSANAHLLEGTRDPTGGDISQALSDFTTWLTTANHDAADRWVGAFAAAADSSGPCGGWPCDERMQCATLAKAALFALDNGHSHFGYATPVEVIGAGADPAMPLATGLLTIELAAGADPLATPIKTRRAYATWMRLKEVLGDVNAADVTNIGQLGPNINGYTLGDAKGWLLWYDWSKETPPGGSYDGSLRGAVLKGLPAGVESVVASSMYPVAVGDTIGADFGANIEWETRVYPVLGGEATVELAGDVVWVVPSTTPPAADTGPVEAVEPGPEANVDSGAKLPSDEEGCGVGSAPNNHLPWWVIAFALVFGTAFTLRRVRASRAPGAPR